MRTREVTSKESGAAAQRRIIFLLIVYVHLVTSQHSGDEAEAEAPPSPPQLPYSSLNSCPEHLIITQILDSCTPPPPPPPPPHDGGDLNPVADEEPIRSVTFAELVVKALSASRKDQGTQWEIIFKLIFPAAVCALFFCEIPLRILCVLLILFVNAVMAILLPAESFWVPALCFASSLLTLIIAP